MVCRLLVHDSPELLFKLREQDGTIFISGDPIYFPAFKGSGELEISNWLSVTTASNQALNKIR
mgnify:CR=1 FL=1